MYKTSYVWDLPLRIFHWLLVVSFTIAYVTSVIGGLWLEWHMHTGLFILSLVVFRICWGFLGSTHSLFRNFFPTPSRLVAFFRSNWNTLGHTPIAALSVFMLIILLSAQVSLGLFTFNDEIEIYGPLYDLIGADMSERFTSYHSTIFDLLTLFILLHLFAVTYYTVLKGKQMLRPMITGFQENENNNTAVAINGGGIVRCLFALFIAGSFFVSLESGYLLQLLLHDPAPLSASPSPPSW